MTKKPGTKGASKPRAAKPKSSPKGNPRAKPGNNFANLTPDEVQALFLSNRQKYIVAVAKRKAAELAVSEIVTEAKADGFTKKELDISMDLADIKGEKKVEADVATRMRVARWIGHKLGNQMDLFAEPDRTPSVDKAFEAGKIASMEGKPRKSPYAETLPQNAAWFDGFDKDQERLQGQVGRGNEDADTEGVAGFDNPPAGGTRMSRADYQAEQVRARQEREAKEAAELQAAQPSVDGDKPAVH